MNATLHFPTYEQAKQFATAWSRATLRGYSISPKQADDSGKVYLDGITEESKAWIDSYAENLNSEILKAEQPLAASLFNPSISELI